MPRALNTVPRVFVCPPAGKPDPSCPPPQPGEVDARPRVRREATKNHTSWYYAFNLVRPRYGKHPAAAELQGRRFERLASEMRKTQSELEQHLPDFAYRLEEPEVLAITERIRRNTFSEAMLECPALQATLSPESLLALREYMAHGSEPNFRIYLENLRYGRRELLYREFLSAVGCDPDAQFAASALTTPLGTTRLAELDVQNRVGLLQMFVREASEQHYGLVRVAWNPREPVSVLARALTDHGPLVVMGELGRDRYLRPPVALPERIEGSPVYAWPPGAPYKPLVRTGAAVVLVGCEKAAGMRARIYFIDPDDVSDPAQEARPRVYAMRYDEFITRCCDVNGIFGSEQSTASFALAGPKNPSWA